MAANASSARPATRVVKPAPTSAYTCDGRTHCSQMRSCEEATYFIQHCPNTKMDGNGDGVPCERQWCG
ncbi:excalibur calcium-binding domain-containing protein [Luteimonas viscosa]|nr:excalibur calcium-binding domain-containing protein [Luteimonas viscosa]